MTALDPTDTAAAHLRRDLVARVPLWTKAVGLGVVHLIREALLMREAILISNQWQFGLGVVRLMWKASNGVIRGHQRY